MKNHRAEKLAKSMLAGNGSVQVKYNISQPSDSFLVENTFEKYAIAAVFASISLVLLINAIKLWVMREYKRLL